MLYLMKVLKNLFGGTHKIASTEIAIKDGRGKAVTLDTLPHGFKYSTEEQWTGRYWIDGKKIYTKTFTTSMAVSSVRVSVNLTSLNIDVMFFIADKSYVKMVDSEGVSYLPLNKPSMAGSSLWGTELSQFRPKYFQVDVGSNYKNYSKTVVVMIEYTCTDR